jgi:hypothetical protein
MPASAVLHLRFQFANCIVSAQFDMVVVVVATANAQREQVPQQST